MSRYDAYADVVSNNEISKIKVKPDYTLRFKESVVMVTDSQYRRELIYQWLIDQWLGVLLILIDVGYLLRSKPVIVACIYTIFVLTVVYLRSVDMTHKTENECELKFYASYCLLVCKKRRWSKEYTRKEYFKFPYHQTSVGYDTRRKILLFFGNMQFEGHLYDNNGQVVEECLTKEEVEGSIITSVDLSVSDVDIVYEIEKHSKWKVEVH
jgi:hypothetical protein